MGRRYGMIMERGEGWATTVPSHFDRIRDNDAAVEDCRIHKAVTTTL